MPKQMEKKTDEIKVLLWAMIVAIERMPFTLHRNTKIAQRRLPVVLFCEYVFLRRYVLGILNSMFQ